MDQELLSPTQSQGRVCNAAEQTSVRLLFKGDITTINSMIHDEYL